MQIFIIAIF